MSDTLKTKGEKVPDLECRIAKLEQRFDNLEASIMAEKDESRRKMDKVFDVLDELKKIQEKQKGFIGGVIFAVSGIFTVVTWFFHDKIGGS